jgi:hypothetical protein
MQKIEPTNINSISQDILKNKSCTVRTKRVSLPNSNIYKKNQQTTIALFAFTLEILLLLISFLLSKIF